MSAVAMNQGAVSSPAMAAKLKPKEHGAYAIVGIPIAASLGITGPTVVGICVAIAAVAGFLAHEPLLVAWGHRGARAQRGTPAASKRLWLLLGMTIGWGALALVLGSTAVRIFLGVCGLLALSSFVLAMAGKHRTLGGQLWGVVGLSAPCVPMLLAGGLTTVGAIEVWTVWLLGFSATTLAVRSVIAFQKRQSRMIHGSALALLTLLTVAVAVSVVRPAVTTMPMLALSWYLMLAPPPAKYLRRVGWTLVAGTLATALWLVTTI